MDFSCQRLGHLCRIREVDCGLSRRFDADLVIYGSATNGVKNVGVAVVVTG